MTLSALLLRHAAKTAINQKQADAPPAFVRAYGVIGSDLATAQARLRELGFKGDGLQMKKDGITIILEKGVVRRLRLLGDPIGTTDRAIDTIGHGPPGSDSLGHAPVHPEPVVNESMKEERLKSLGFWSPHIQRIGFLPYGVVKDGGKVYLVGMNGMDEQGCYAPHPGFCYPAPWAKGLVEPRTEANLAPSKLQARVLGGDFSVAGQWLGQLRWIGEIGDWLRIRFERGDIWVAYDGLITLGQNVGVPAPPATSPGR